MSGIRSRGDYGRNIYIADKSIEFGRDVPFDLLIDKKICHPLENRPLTYIRPSGNGGINDNLSRILGEEFSLKKLLNFLHAINFGKFHYNERSVASSF